MSKGKSGKKRTLKSSSIKLPIGGETIFSRIINPHKTGDQGQMHIDRIYAQGGFVVVQILNYATNDLQKRMLAPDEAAYRMASLLQTTPPEYLPAGLREAVVKACMAAKRQTLDGENEFYKMNKADSVEDIIEEIYKEMAEARRLDAELDEEMKKVESKSKKK